MKIAQKWKLFYLIYWTWALLLLEILYYLLLFTQQCVNKIRSLCCFKCHADCWTWQPDAAQFHICLVLFFLWIAFTRSLPAMNMIFDGSRWKDFSKNYVNLLRHSIYALAFQTKAKTSEVSKNICEERLQHTIMQVVHLPCLTFFREDVWTWMFNT